GQPLDLDAVRLVGGPPPEELPILTEHHVDYRSLDLELGEADPERRIREIGAFARIRVRGQRRAGIRAGLNARLIPQKVALEHGARSHAVELGRLHADAETRVANTEREARVRTVGGPAAGDEGAAGHLRQAPRAVQDHVPFEKAVERRGPAAEDDALLGGRVLA